MDNALSREKPLGAHALQDGESGQEARLAAARGDHRHRSGRILDRPAVLRVQDVAVAYAVLEEVAARVAARGYPALFQAEGRQGHAATHVLDHHVPGAAVPPRSRG